MVRLLLHLMFVRYVPLPCADGQTFWFVFLCMSRLSCCHLCRFVVVRICACCSRWSRRLSLCFEFGHSVRCLCIVNLGRVLHVEKACDSQAGAALVQLFSDVSGLFWRWWFSCAFISVCCMPFDWQLQFATDCCQTPSVYVGACCLASAWFKNDW